MSWRIKQFIRKLMPWIFIGAVAFGGYHLYQESGGKRGKFSITRLVRQIPVVGKHLAPAPRRSYKKGRASYASRGKYAKRRHKARRSRRSRRR